MSRVYVGDTGTAVEVQTFIDLTTATTKEILVKRPDGSILTKTATYPSGYTASHGRIFFASLVTDFNEAGTYYVQAHIASVSTDHLGDNTSFIVYSVYDGN